MSNDAPQNVSKNPIQTTSDDRGLRAKKGLAEHLFVKNAYEKNLLSDISKVDYLGGNRGRTHICPSWSCRVCRRYVRIRVPMFGVHGSILRRYLLYDRRRWIRTERHGKYTHNPSRHTGHQTEYRGAYPTQGTTRKGGSLYDTKYPCQDRKGHEHGRSQNVEKCMKATNPAG